MWKHQFLETECSQPLQPLDMQIDIHKKVKGGENSDKSFRLEKNGATISVTWWVREKIAQNVAQTFFVKINNTNFFPF
jgi:hypothetical protein